MKHTQLGLFQNSEYKVGRGPFVQAVWYLINVIVFINPLFPISKLKVTLLRLFGAKVGANVNIKPSVNIKYPWNLSIGDNVWIGERVWIDNLCMVIIEDNVCISQGAMLLTGNHNYKKVTFDLIVGKIVLHPGVWIGAQAVVCPGVTCLSHSILSVGSVATSDLKEYSIYQGNPAIKIRDRVFL